MLKHFKMIPFIWYTKTWYRFSLCNSTKKLTFCRWSAHCVIHITPHQNGTHGQKSIWCTVHSAQNIWHHTDHGYRKLTVAQHQSPFYNTSCTNHLEILQLAAGFIFHEKPLLSGTFCLRPNVLRDTRFDRVYSLLRSSLRTPDSH